MERIPHYCVLTGNESPVEIARKFLWVERYSDGDVYQIKFFRGDFWVYDGARYKRVTREALELEVLAFLQDQKALSGKTTAQHSRNILLNIAALTKISDELEPPCFLDKSSENKSQYINLKNGIFDLGLYMQKKKPLLRHTPKFFSMNCLPFNYNSKAKCPTWKNFILEVVPEQGMPTLVQDWFGYGLTNDTSLHTFVLMVGSGANGKSVVCTVLRELLGRENISAVALEQFTPSRTFPLHAMVGKIANIVEEIGDVQKVAEDILKNIVGGGEMTIEQKGRDPVLVKFRTKLTFATNVVPRFKDRSDGTWRRIIFIPFKVQTLDPKKQNKNLVNGSWWVNSGEMEGILNWALEGLVRVTKRGCFIEPPSSIAMKEEYREEANPAAVFIREYYEIKEGGNLCSDKIYSTYSKEIKDQGGQPLGKSMFTREVKKVFPCARLSKHAKTRRVAPGLRTKVRTRLWENLREKR